MLCILCAPLVLREEVTTALMYGGAVGALAGAGVGFVAALGVILGVGLSDEPALLVMGGALLLSAIVGWIGGVSRWTLKRRPVLIGRRGPTGDRRHAPAISVLRGCARAARLLANAASGAAASTERCAYTMG